jgi:uncharacterized membrane protein YuzA (DUF378 family)
VKRVAFEIVGLASLICCHLFFSFAQRCFPSPASALLTSA